MTGQLRQAIQQFAKRQQTWFRRMERQGIPIRWIGHAWPIRQQVAEVLLHR